MSSPLYCFATTTNLCIYFLLHSTIIMVLASPDPSYEIAVSISTRVHCAMQISSPPHPLSQPAVYLQVLLVVCLPSKRFCFPCSQHDSYSCLVTPAFTYEPCIVSVSFYALPYVLGVSTLPYSSLLLRNFLPYQPITYGWQAASLHYLHAISLPRFSHVCFKWINSQIYSQCFITRHFQEFKYFRRCYHRCRFRTFHQLRRGGEWAILRVMF